MYRVVAPRPDNRTVLTTKEVFDISTDTHIQTLCVYKHTHSYQILMYSNYFFRISFILLDCEGG